jgi:hypothetical protein
VVSEQTWPPPAESEADWIERTVRVRGLSTETIRVRTVTLWGRRVEINADGDVWCPSCWDFKTPVQLTHPWNSCPVGLPARGGVVPVEDSTLDDEPKYLPVRPPSQFKDLMREPW